MASEELERLLAAIFEADFCEPGEKAERERVLGKLLDEHSACCGQPAQLILQAVLQGRYPEYRRQRLARELPSVPPRPRPS